MAKAMTTDAADGERAGKRRAMRESGLPKGTVLAQLHDGRKNAELASVNGWDPACSTQHRKPLLPCHRRISECSVRDPGD